MADLRTTRAVLAGTAGLALLSVGAQYPLSLSDGERGFVFETVEYFGYFTIVSNLVVALGAGLLAVDPSRREPWVAAVRLAGVIMIVITGLGYHLLLAADNETTGLGVWTDLGLHTVVPIVTVVGWLAVGPRGLVTWQEVHRSLRIPAVWLVYALVRGQVTGEPVYPFMDVQTLGVGTVAVTLLVISAFALVLGLLLLGIDRALARWGALEPAMERVEETDA
jgi:hypothetical protein